MRTIQADLADPASFEMIVSNALGQSGRIDILVNNAGIGQGSIRADQRRNPLRFWEITPEQWGRFVVVNATAPLMMARAVVPHMLRAKRGRIVTVTTSLGTMLREGYVLYGASKAAAEAATRGWPPILPAPASPRMLVPGGMTDTRIIPEAAFADRSRLLRPGIMTTPLRWLVSDDAANVTGRRFLAARRDISPPPAEARRIAARRSPGNRLRRCRSSPTDRKGAGFMAEQAIANTAQRDYWNTVAGPRWVGLEGLVERRVRAVNDLLLARSGAKAGEHVLEIGCGTGAFTVPLAEAVGETGGVVGADISSAMLTAARKRLADLGLHNVSLIEADAQTHKFKPGSFDLITSRFGVMFFADPGQRVHQSFRRRPARRKIVFCVLGRPRRERALAYSLSGRLTPSWPT